MALKKQSSMLEASFVFFDLNRRLANDVKSRVQADRGFQARSFGTPHPNLRDGYAAYKRLVPPDYHERGIFVAPV